MPIYRVALMYLLSSFQAFLYSISHLLIILIILMSYQLDLSKVGFVNIAINSTVSSLCYFFQVQYGDSVHFQVSYPIYFLVSILTLLLMFVPIAYYFIVVRQVWFYCNYFSA